MTKEPYVQVDGKLLRTGYTTGTCACAAAAAAAYHLFHGVAQERVTVTLPRGETLEIALHRSEFDPHGQVAMASVIKDGGDDQDVTHGLEICARVKRIPETTLRILGGPGVGRVTKKGLSVPVGEAAINPTPQNMIQEHLGHYLEFGHGLEVTIEVPLGAEAAKKTFNPRLGIEGGISIIGTTGLVLPMSEEGFKQSLVVCLKQALAHGHKNLVFVFGNYGEGYSLSQGIAPMAIIKMSNFVGFMLDEARVRGVKQVTIVGNIGKLIKVAGGIFHTHSHVSDGKMEIMVAHLALMGAPLTLLEKVRDANTTEEAVAIIDHFGGYQGIYPKLAHLAKSRCQQHVHHKVEVDIVLFSDKSRFLAQTMSSFGVTGGGAGEDQGPQAPLLPLYPLLPLTCLGVGPGGPKFMTHAALEAISRARVLIGARRHFDVIGHDLNPHGDRHLVNGRVAEMVQIIEGYRKGPLGDQGIVVLASGDPLVFGIATSLRRYFPSIEVISGISALQYMFTKIPQDMNDVYITSSHGRALEADLLRNHGKIAMVTDGRYGPKEIARLVYEGGASDPGYTLYVGTNLGYGDEALVSGPPESLLDFDTPGLHGVVIVKNTLKKGDSNLEG